MLIEMSLFKSWRVDYRARNQPKKIQDFQEMHGLIEMTRIVPA